MLKTKGKNFRKLYILNNVKESSISLTQSLTPTGVGLWCFRGFSEFQNARRNPGLFRLSLVASFSPSPFIQRFLYGGAVQDGQLFIESIPRYVRMANTVY